MVGLRLFYNEHMKSRPYFLPAIRVKPEARQNQFGGTLGGPNRQEQAVLLRELRRTNDRQKAQRFGTVPTARCGEAIFFRLADADLRPVDRRGERQRRTPFPGNSFSQPSRPDVQKLIRPLPLPDIS